MKPSEIEISQISIIDRQRIELGDIAGLAESIQRCGVIQPVILDTTNRLIAGRRRIAACVHLGMSRIPFVHKEKMSEGKLQELELEEDIRRKDRTWQERCIAVAKVHHLKVNESTLEGDSWGQRQTGEMLNIPLGHVSWTLNVARRLNKDKDDPIWKCDSLADANRLLMREQEDRDLAKIAELERAKTNSVSQEKVEKAVIAQVELIEMDETGDRLKFEREKYESNKLNTIPFAEYWAEKTKMADEARNTMYLSNRFIHADSIEYMLREEQRGRFDHIITDIPYAIEMDMLEQENTGMKVDLVREEHDVEYNMELIKAFFPAAYQATKERAFVVTWCDQMLWQTMYNLAVEAGFAVQRWPLTWVKTSASGNQAAQYNYTKNTEIAIVCRKPTTVLTKPSPDCVVVAGNEEMKRAIGHPFAKPFECWKKIADHVALPGQLILEPFAGRGSGTLSMLKMGYNVISVEKNADHFNHLLENMKQLYYLKLNPKYVFK